MLISSVNSISALTIYSVSSSPSEISPGESSRIIMSIKNNANEDIEDVSVSLDLTNLPLAPYESGSDFNANEILEGKTKEAEFNIIVLDDAKAGTYKIPVKIVYTDSSGVKNQQSLISIKINSKPSIETNVEDGLLLKGEKNSLTIKIVNKGLSDAKFLEVSAGSSTNYIILSQNKVYIGDVDSNDFQTAEFSIFINAKASNNINFPISVKYKDFANKEYNEDFDVKLRVYSRDQAQKLGLISKNNTLYIVVIIVVLIIVFFIYRAIRKRRRKEKSGPK